MFEILLAFTVEAYIELREDTLTQLESESLKTLTYFEGLNLSLWHRRVRRKRWDYFSHQTFQDERQAKDKLNDQ